MTSKSKIKIIGAIHLPPLLGFPDFPGYKVALQNAKKDLLAFEKGGADAVIIENNYDLPHTANVPTSVAVSFGKILGELRSSTKLPIGISVLWNDYKTALALAVTYKCDFIRVPVFVDKVESSYGIMEPVYKKLATEKKNLGASKIKILADIHVKHAKLLSKLSLANSAKMAMKFGADGVIITGKWTGEEPSIEDVLKISALKEKIPIYLGSGVSDKNIHKYSKYIKGVIVSTSLKKDSTLVHKINVKPYSSRIDIHKVKKLRHQIDK